MEIKLIWQHASNEAWRQFRWIPGPRRCNVCGGSVLRFLPYRGGWADVPPLMRALNVVGSDVANFGCPHCRAHDRERHLFFFFERAGLFAGLPRMRVLHMAPERHLSRKLAQLKPLEYIKGDLFPAAEDVQKLDLLALPFQDGYFDLFIANHVMEHVADDRQALAEIVRVLKPGGLAVLQTPFSAVLRHTLEDPGIQTEEARLHAYGQEDHARLYGQDWITRFESCGLQSQVRSHAQLLPDVDAHTFGLNAQEPFMCFQKP